MTREAFDQGNWQGVIETHPLESHDPVEWLRYGVALLQTIQPGTDAGKLQQQAALAFVQAIKEGATTDAAKASQEQAMLISLSEALHHAGMPDSSQRAKKRADLQKRITNKLIQGSQGMTTIRTLHHLACTGGTVISKCIASMPNVALISELNPLNRFGSKFEPTNPLLLLERSYRKLTLEEIKEDFKGRISQTISICNKDGMDLVIRDHSHSDFCMGEHPSDLTPICDFLSGTYRLLSAVTVRHPLDSYLGMTAQNWNEQFTPSTLDEYCRRYLSFLERYKDLPLLRYEDFCKSPNEFMQDLCKELEITYSDDFIYNFGTIRLSGDSGRSSNTEIKPRSRRAVPQEVLDETYRSDHYKILLAKLCYEA